MKKNLLYTLIIGLSILVGCGGDDPAPAPHEVGTWDLNSYLLLNVPGDYDNNEGRILQLNDLSLSGVVITKYTLNLNADLTFSRKIERAGPSINDDGTWELDGDDLTLESEDAGTLDFNVERNENDQLWLGQSTQFALLKNSVADTITSEYINTLTDQEFFDLFDTVTLDLVFAFERDN